MQRMLDATRDLRELATLASRPESVDDLLVRALDGIRAIVPYDLAAVLELDGEVLSIRTARGPLDGPAVRRHRVPLDRFPTVRRAVETRRPVALLEEHHASAEGDPYDGVLDLPDGHSCMVVPLFAGDRTLGAMTFDRRVCEPYRPEVVEVAGVYGQIVSLALAMAEQAALLDRYRRRLQEQNRYLAEESTPEADGGEAVAALPSPAMRQVARLARQVAATDAAVLITGETGTGKEVLAHAVHGWSDRREGPFVKLNCAAIPENLVESELFGHTRGAFSGADRARPGRFLVANGGTLFLDEVGDLPASAQAKLLRVLQDGTFFAVGADRATRVDVRVLAATHVDLEAAVKEGRFREDLYYRLAVFPIRLPPLRERAEDIPVLARRILDAIHRRSGRGPWTLAPDGLPALLAAPWPGNVRQLSNALERATILVPRGEVRVDGLAPAPPAPLGPEPVADAPILTLAEMERRHIERVVRACHGRIYGPDGAAARLGVPPSTLQSRMKKLGAARGG